MGFEYAPKTYALTFAEGHDLAGLTAEVGSLTIAALMDLELALNAAPETVAEAVANMAKVVEIFAGALRSWNLTSNGEPVPVRLESVRAQDSGLILPMVREWRGAMLSVPPPLPVPSSNGVSTGLEGSLPMEPLSPSPPS